MKIITKSEYKNLEKDDYGYTMCDLADYKLIKYFRAQCIFDDKGYVFGNSVTFGLGCEFGENSVFGENCKFKGVNEFGKNCVFGKGCTFDKTYGYIFGEGCIFN